MDVVRLVPSADEQAWLRTSFAELVSAAGFEHTVAVPLALPDEDHFPDRWTPDGFGVRRLALRLLRYAGLDDLEVSVELFEGEREVELDGHGHARNSRHKGAAAWFAGIEDGVCIFGAELSQLDDPLGIVAAMAHEIAHAFRCAHELEVDDRDEEERLTDLTTVYLGFGLLTTNATSRHRSSGDTFTLQWSHRTLGYLPPQAMSWALALWCRARGLGRTEVRRIAGALETNQAGYFKAALAELPEAEALRSEIGIPPRDRWPDPIPLAELVAPIADDEALVEQEAQMRAEGAPRHLPNAGHPVFRVRRTRAIQFFGLGLVLGCLATVASFSFAAYLLAAEAAGPLIRVALWLPVVGAIVGAAIGRRKRYDYCSDPACEHVVTASDPACPGCGGTLAGEIRRRSDRLDAEERLLNGRD